MTNAERTLAANLQQDREDLELFSADEHPELVAALKASIAESKKALEHMGVFVV